MMWSESAAAVNSYQTLAAVPGNRHDSLSAASSASVVASVVSIDSENGSAVIAVLPAYVSLPGVLARTGPARAALTVSTTATDNTLLIVRTSRWPGRCPRRTCCSNECPRGGFLQSRRISLARGGLNYRRRRVLNR